MTVLIDQRRAPVAQQRDRSNRLYHGDFAWPTAIDITTGAVRLRLGSVVDAVFLRAGFAAEVNSFLVRHLFRGPILTVPGEPDDWIFITQSRTTMRQKAWEDLVRIQVGWKRRGDTIPLPALDDPGEGARWLQPPRHRSDLPPWSTLVAAVRTVSSMRGTS